MILEKISKIFRDNFNQNPNVFKSPGRINLIGEHTDYNNGFVLPASINKAIYIAINKSDSNESKLMAFDLDSEFTFNVNSVSKSDKKWPNYILGIVDQLNKKGISIPNFNAVFGGDIPLGAGLSSSAAVGVGFLFALNEIYDLNLNNYEIAKLTQKAENEFAGVNCGIMDMFANLFGQEKSVLKLDCRSLEYEFFPFDFENIDILLCDTGVSHSLADSEYNLRREQCETGVKIISEFEDNVLSLRDVTLEMLETHKSFISAVVYDRCNYVVKENERVLSACSALASSDLIGFGQLMYETHKGLKNEFEVSCDELDFLVDKAKSIDGVYGSRMMGGGFGGCTINLVEKSKLKNIEKGLTDLYKSKFNLALKTYVTSIEKGTVDLTNKIEELDFNDAK